MKFQRRAYYDHEGVYRRLRDQGYTGWGPPDRGNPLEYIEVFLASEFAPNPSYALDLGCGGGEVSIHLAKLGWKVLGIDYSETAIELARENAVIAGVDVEFLVADVAKPLTLKKGSFALVLDYLVRHCLIEHSDRRTFMLNAYEALSNGGIMLGVNMTSDGYLDYDLSGGIDQKTRIDAWRTRYFAPLSELLSEFDEVGFSVEHLELQQDPRKDPCSTATIYASKR